MATSTREEIKVGQLAIRFLVGVSSHDRILVRGL